jgi:flagellar L-ring protein FlgH
MARRYRGIAGFALWLMAQAAFGQSLYDSTTYRPLSTDLRAHAVGDAITVLIFEAATASSTASTSASRSSSIAARASDFGEPVGGDLSIDNDFDGGGEERRSGQLVAQITVTVREVLPNGDLVVQGDQQISLNSESQRILVEGRVRPQDIQADNSVLSSRMADARIEFKGRGLLSAREKPGLLARLFHWIF